MTRIDFHSNVQDKKLSMLGLVQQLVDKKHQVTIFVADEATAKDYSMALWASNETSFLAHVLATDTLAEDSPMLLDWEEKRLCQDDILINLTERQLTAFSRFKRLIELVGHDEQDKVLARQRFKFYRDRGYEVRHFDKANQ